MCQHFVSDLIWAVLNTDMVPVVFGKKTLGCMHPWNPLFRWSELLKASAKGLLYWCTQSVSKKSCPLSQVRLRLCPNYKQALTQVLGSKWRAVLKLFALERFLQGGNTGRSSFPVPQSLELSGLHSAGQNLLFWAFIGQSWLCELCSSLDPNPDQIALPHTQVLVCSYQ